MLEANRPTSARNGHARRIPASKAAGSFKQTVVASSLFEDALALDPRAVEAQSRLASALSARVMIGIADPAAADIARAEALAGQALAAAPGSPLAHYAKGEVLRVQNRCDEAIFEFETVLAFNHNAIGALFHLVQSRTDDAIVWLEKARSAVPELPNVHALLACACALQGAAERAATELAAARKLSSDDRFSSIARLTAAGLLAVPGYFGVPKVRALFDATYFCRPAQSRGPGGVTAGRGLSSTELAGIGPIPVQCLAAAPRSRSITVRSNAETTKVR